MSDGKNPIPSQVRDTMIFVGWIAGLIFIASLCWFLTQSARNRFLLTAVNRVLEQSGDSRRLAEPVPYGSLKAGSSGIGSWYIMKDVPEETTACIFTFIGEGAFFPCAAVVTAEGKVEEFIPLNNHGERILKRISPGFLRLYARRIEGARS